MVTLAILLGVLFVLLMIAAVAVRELLNSTGLECECNRCMIDELQEHIVIMQERIIMMETSYEHDMGVLSARLATIGGHVDSLISDELDAAAIRAQFEENLHTMTNWVDAWQVWTLDSLICASRNGHNFECTDVTMGNDEPFYRFECKFCHLCYVATDSFLTKDEAAIAGAFVKDQLKQVKITMKRYMPSKREK